jgi:hypothetical protein
MDHGEEARATPQCRTANAADEDKSHLVLGRIIAVGPDRGADGASLSQWGVHLTPRLRRTGGENPDILNWNL